MEEESDQKPLEYFLLRVPKGIETSELNGLKIDLATSRPSSADVDNIGYYCSTRPDTTFNHLTILGKSTKAGADTSHDFSLELNHALAGSVSFYRSHSSVIDTDSFEPLVPSCPNDSIAKIVGRNKRARGGSRKKMTLKENKRKREKRINRT